MEGRAATFSSGNRAEYGIYTRFQLLSDSENLSDATGCYLPQIGNYQNLVVRKKTKGNFVFRGRDFEPSHFVEIADYENV